MDKDILFQYCEMKEEIKDLRQRIMKLDKFLQDKKTQVISQSRKLHEARHKSEPTVYMELTKK